MTTHKKAGARGTARKRLPKLLKIFLYAGAALLGLFILVTVLATYFLDMNAFKPRLEAAASQALGMKVQVDGNLHIGFSPGLSLLLEQVRVHNRGIELGTAQQVKIRIDFLSLLKNKPRVRGIAFKQAKLSIERDPRGLFNFEETAKPKGTPRTLDLTSLAARSSGFLYVDKQSGNKIEGQGCELEASRLRLTGVSGRDLMKNVDLNAKLACARVLSKKILVTDLKLNVHGEKGIYQLQPVSMHVLDGAGTGQLAADFTNAEPHWLVHYHLEKFNVARVLETLQPKYAVKGLLDFSTKLALRGRSWKALQETASGSAVLQGENLSLAGRDLDQELARYDSTQNFNLVDAGALFFAGPVGIAITKGYDFANLFRGKGGTTPIRRLVSRWQVEHGVADAQDVALATRENFLALQGGLDFANKRFEHVTVALVNERGCTRIRQKIRGPFNKPVVEKPNIIQAVTAPIRKLLKKTKEVFTGHECELFYRGSLLPPAQPEGAPPG